MSYEFVEYKSAGERSRFAPQIILGQGGFTFSVGFARKYETYLGDVSQQALKLFFDETKRAIGFKFVPKDEEGAVRIKKLSHGGYYINARAFLVKYDIERSKHEARYTPQETDTPQGKLGVVELKGKSAG